MNNQITRKKRICARNRCISRLYWSKRITSLCKHTTQKPPWKKGGLEKPSLSKRISIVSQLTGTSVSKSLLYSTTLTPLLLKPKRWKEVNSVWTVVSTQQVRFTLSKGEVPPGPQRSGFLPHHQESFLYTRISLTGTHMSLKKLENKMATLVDTRNGFSETGLKSSSKYHLLSKVR